MPHFPSRACPRKGQTGDWGYTMPAKSLRDTTMYSWTRKFREKPLCSGFGFPSPHVSPQAVLSPDPSLWLLSAFSTAQDTVGNVCRRRMCHSFIIILNLLPFSAIFLLYIHFLFLITIIDNFLQFIKAEFSIFFIFFPAITLQR